MDVLKTSLITATGGMGVLVAGLVISKSFEMQLESVFGPALLIFVVGGAIALVARAVRR